MQKNNYVYLIQPREFIRLNEQTYKIGKTTQEINKRMYGYPKSSKVILFIEVGSCDKIETEIITTFKQKFKHMTTYGNEYFNGNKYDMINEFLKISDPSDYNKHEINQTLNSNNSNKHEINQTLNSNNSNKHEINQTLNSNNSNKENLIDEVRKISFKCDQCGESCSTNGNLTRHMKKCLIKDKCIIRVK